MAYNDLGYIAADSPILSQIDEAAKRYGVDRNLAHAVAQMESQYNPKADSGKAQGVMQLTPDTARYLGVKNVWDSKENIDAGMRYLRDLHKQFGGKQDLVLAAYNAGPGRVDQYKGVPPFPETQSYVKRGTTLLAQAQHPAASNYDDLGYVSVAPAPQQAAASVKHPMPEPPGAPKIAVEPVPVPPGFGQRVYGQTLGPAVDLAKSLKADPAGTLKQTAANLFGVTQYQTILKQLQAGQYVPAAISILSFKNPGQMQAEAMTTPAIEDARTGNWLGLGGDVVGGAIALAGPKILSKVPGAARVTGAGVRAAAPDVAGGALKVGAGALMEHMIPGPSPLKYAFEGYTGYAGARQIGRGLGKGVAATRQALRDRAAAAAATLAKERAAAQAAAAQAARPVPVPVERQLPPGATRMPAAADTSGIRSVPGEYAAPDPLPPSRQLAAPGRPAIITPAPDPLAGDTSGVRAVPAVYGTSATNEAATGMREAMGLQPGELAPPAARTAPVTARASQIDQMARHMRQSGITATQAALLDPPELAGLAKAAGIEGALGKVAVAVRKRLAAMEKAEAETAKYQAAWDKLKPAEKAAVTGEAEAPAVERKPPASAPAAEPTVTTPADANVELGKSLSVEMPAEKPPALTASQKRVQGMAAILAEGEIPVEQLRGGLKTDVRARLFLESESRRLGYGKIAAGELDKIIAEIERLRAQSPVAK